jgi:hypothetical protein
LLQNNKRLLESPKSSASKKARLFDGDNFKATSKLLIPLCPNSPKYRPNSLIQTDRLQRLVTMIVKCMLPISIVENPAFVEYINYIDPSFSMPVRPTVKNTALPQLKTLVKNKIQSILKMIPSVSTSMDAWTDAAVRPYNGFIAQGIDILWNLHTIPIAFEYIEGNINIYKHI